MPASASPTAAEPDGPDPDGPELDGPDPDGPEVGPIRRRWRAKKSAVIHGHRTRLRVRRRIDRAAWLAVTAGVLLVVAVRHLVTDVTSAEVVVAVILAGFATRLAMMRPPSPPHAHGFGDEPRGSCPPQRPDRSPWVAAVRCLGVLVAIAVAAGLPSWSVLTFTAALLVAAAPVLQEVGRVHRARRRLRSLLVAHDARWALVYAGMAGGPTHLMMWEPHLVRSGVPGVLVNARPEYCQRLRDQMDLSVPWIQLGSDVLGDLTRIVPGSVRAFFHVHNAPAHLKYFGIRTVRHVWLGHGDSDKPGSRHPRHQNFDVLVVSGQAAIDRYAAAGVEIPLDRFRIVGRPQVEVLTRTVTRPHGRPTVLYAPTWTGKYEHLNFSSIRRGRRIVSAMIAAGCDVVFRPHPVFLRTDLKRLVDKIDDVLAADTADPSTPGQHVWGDVPNTQWSIFECMNHADILVSDVSSVISDWLVTSRPFAMLNMKHTREQFVREFPVAAGAQIVARNLSNLPAVLLDMLGDDSLAQSRRQLARHVLGGFDGTAAAQAFGELVHEVSWADPPDVRRPQPGAVPRSDAASPSGPDTMSTCASTLPPTTRDSNSRNISSPG